MARKRRSKLRNKQRNKPKEPPKPPEKAPFFLPTLPGVEHRFAILQQDETDIEAKKKSSRKLEAGATLTESTFYKRLTSEDPDGDCESYCRSLRVTLLIISKPDFSWHFLDFDDAGCWIDESLFSYVKTLTPAAIDLELRALISIDALSTFVGALIRRLRVRKDFDAVQAFIGVLLRLHGEIFLANPELLECLEKLQEAHLEESRKVLDNISASLGTLSFIRDVL